MKKSLCMILAIVLLLAAAPCALASDGDGTPYVLVAYSTGGADSMMTKTLQEYARLVDEASSGRVRLDVTSSGLLGDGAQALAAAGTGAIDILAADTAAYAALCEPVRMLELPLVFDSAEQAVSAANGSAGASLFRGLADGGLVFLAEGSAGMRHVLTTGQPVRTAGDVTGLTLSIPDDALCADFWTALGAVPSVTSAAELPAAGNNGAAVAADIAPLCQPSPEPEPTEPPAEGEEAPAETPVPPPTIYFSSLGYMWKGFTITVSQKTWMALPAEVQTVLQEQALAAAQYSLDTGAAEEADALAAMQEAGVEVISDPSLSSFRTALGGDAYYDRYQEQTWYDKSLLTGLLAAQ